MGKKPSSREALLDAAEAVVGRAGAAHMTLDAVAARAGVSKGGLLYHFRSKETLLKAMVAREIERFEAAEAQARKALPAGLAGDLMAYVQCAVARPSRPRRLRTALLAAGANQPSLLSGLQGKYRQKVQELARRPEHFARALAVMLAADGLCLLELLRISPLRPAEKRKVQAELLTLCRSVGRGRARAT
jgi:AcrR family transcriptional regulator